MRKTILAAIAVMFMVICTSCGTTFQERKVVYKKIFSVLKEKGPKAARLFLKYEEEKGKITAEEAEEYNTLLNEAEGLLEEE